MAILTRKLGARLLSAALGTMLFVGACADKKGALILAINTDMKAPKDVNAVSVTVSTNGAIKHSFIGRVTPDGDVLLPATLAIVQPDDASATVRVRVMAFQERKPRVLRDVRTTVPRDGRTGLLRIPLNFINDGMLTGDPLPNGVLSPAPGTGGTGGGATGGGEGAGGAASFDFFGAFQPPCPDIENQTVIDGECQDNAIDAAALPDYDDSLVFGSGRDGADKAGCFDVTTCYGGATVVQGGPDVTPGKDNPDAGADGGTGMRTLTPQGVSIDTSTCTVNGVADPTQLNLAIVTPDTGECVKPGECYIPIDQGPTGWHVDSGRVQLPPLVCKLLGKGLRLFATSGTCKAKTEKQPICRPAPANNNAPPGGNRLQCLTTCGECVVEHCSHDSIAACFGPDWDKGKVTGACSPLYQCGCSCSDFKNCKQCDAAAMGTDCQTCLNQNINACANDACKAECNTSGGPMSDAGPIAGDVNVHLTLNPIDPPPTPPVGGVFDATNGMFSNPVANDSSVSAGSATGTSIKVEWCTGSLSVGKTFLQFSTSPGCTNGNPSVRFTQPTGNGQWIAGLGTPGQQGGLVVQSLTPLTFTFQGIKMAPDPNSKTTTGGFSIDGAGSWPNAGP